NKRKKQIAECLANLSKSKQVIIFTHDLVFVSDILNQFEDEEQYSCHCIENIGKIWTDNAPCHEKKYQNSKYPQKYYDDCTKSSCEPRQREEFLKQGFAALRTCYEVLVIYKFFNGTVRRWDERVRIGSLSKVCLKEDLINKLIDSYHRCCRYMEGHSHSDEYSYKKPEPENLKEEIDQYETIRKEIETSKNSKK
ncbi:MAG: hypothetical protein LBN01_05080, partial [Endomicrobium sp.]|nr:hypothetical protein [Endomicrobium sp.]